MHNVDKFVDNFKFNRIIRQVSDFRYLPFGLENFLSGGIITLICAKMIGS